MKIRNSILAFSIAAAAVPAAFAASSLGSQPFDSQVTRAQVQHELQEFSAHPVLYDGTVLLHGELGYVSADQVGIAYREPHGQTHVLGSSGARDSTAAAPPVSAAEHRAEREQYMY